LQIKLINGTDIYPQIFIMRDKMTGKTQPIENVAQANKRDETPSAEETSQVACKDAGTSGVSIAFTNANYEETVSILRHNENMPLQLLIYQNAFVKMDADPALKDQLKGHKKDKGHEENRFYVDGDGSRLSSGYYHFNEDGELMAGKGDIERTIFVYIDAHKSQKLSIYVYGDEEAERGGRRYALDRYESPTTEANVVVGEAATASPSQANLLRSDEKA
jgi:hypothetical protein